MNWTGGARARASKASTGTAAKQKQYFARVRGQATSAAFRGTTLPSTFEERSSSSPEKRRKVAVPEFDIIVTIQKPEAVVGRGQKDGDGDGAKEFVLGDSKKRKLGKEQIRSRKNKLLETDDWVCTAVTAPLKEIPSKRALSTLGKLHQSQPPALRNVFQKEIHRSAPPPRPPASRASQSITEASTEYMETRFNAFQALSQGGYVRIGKGKPAGRFDGKFMMRGALEGIDRDVLRKPGVESQDSMLLDEEEEEQQRLFLPGPPTDANVSADELNETEPVHGHKNIAPYRFWPSSDPFESPTLPAHIPRHSNHQDASWTVSSEAGSRGDDGYSPKVPLGSTPHSALPSRAYVHPLRIDTPSSPTSYVTHYVSDMFRCYSSETGSEEEQQQWNEVERELESSVEGADENGDFELQAPREPNPSVVAFTSSSRGFLSSEFDNGSKLSGTFFGDPPPEDIDTRWRKFMQPLSEDKGAKNSNGRNGTDPEVAGERNEPESPKGRAECSQEQPGANGMEGELSKDLQLQDPLSTVTHELFIPEDIQTQWKGFINGIKETVAPHQNTALNLEDPSEVSLPPNLSIANSRVGFTEEESKAWRQFVFALSSLDNSEDDELYAPPVPKPRSGKEFTALTEIQSSPIPAHIDGKRFTALTTSSSSRGLWSGEAVMGDSSVGNETSVPQIESGPTNCGETESMAVNLFSESSIVSPKVCGGTWKRPKRFVSCSKSASIDWVEDIEDW